ncbi:MAG: ABC transporter ATP-binding protein [Saprospiraceae bacterium]
MTKIPVFPDLIYFTGIYRKYVGTRWIFFLFTAIIPAFLDGIGISMVIPLLNLVMDPTGLNVNVAEGNSDFAYQLLLLFGIPVNLNNILLFIAGVYVFKFIVGFTNSTIKSYMYAALIRDMRYNLYTRLMCIDYAVFKEKSTGYYTNLATTQMNQFLNGFLYLTQFYTKVFAALAYLSFSFFIDWKFSLIAAFSGLLVIGSFRGFNKQIKKLSTQTAQQESFLTGFFIQAMQAFKYLAATGGFHIFDRKLKDSVEKIKKQRLKSEFIRNLFDTSYETLTVFFVCFLIWVQVSYMGKPLASMLMSIFLFHRAVGNILITQKDWQHILNISGGISSVINEFNISIQSREKQGSVMLKKLENNISFNKVQFAYNHKPVIQDFSVDIPVKKMVALVGESGAGKTTLVDLLTLVLKPERGYIVVDGISHEELNLTSWRQKIGFVSQDVQLFDDTIANNICLWQTDYQTVNGKEKIEKAARLAHCHEFIEQTENGYLSWIGDRGLKLSGGQRQRIAIARELFKEPELLILDEATSALDSETEYFIKETLRELKGQLTVVMIAHRLSTVKEADFIIVMKNGSIEEVGTFEHLASTSGYFSEMVEYQKL